jgi:hypothetical protein
MTGQQFKYFLMDGSGRFYAYSNGLVSLVSTPSPLFATPDGWLDIVIQRERGPKYFALDRSFSLPLNYVKDGAAIVKNSFYKKGFEDKLYQVIAKQRMYWQEATGFLFDENGNKILDENGNPILSESMPDFGFYYSLTYKGEVDLSTFVHSGAKVSCSIMEGDYVKLIKAFENTQYAIPLDPSIIVQMDGIQLVQSASWVVGGEQLDNHVLGLFFVSIEAVSSIGASTQNLKGVSNTLPDIWNIQESFLQTYNTDTTVTLTWDFYATMAWLNPLFDPQNGTYMQLQLIILKDVSTTPAITTIQQFGGGSASALYGHEQHFSGSMTIAIPAGHRASLFMNITHSSSASRVTYKTDNSTVTASYLYTHKASLISAMRPFDLFKAIAAKMGIVNVQSNFLQTYNYIVLATGDSLRGFNKSMIKTSLHDFYQSWNCLFPIAMGVRNGVLILELKEDFVKYDNPIALGQCSNLKTSISTDYVFNTLKIGFPVQDMQDVNGRQEFNNTHTYTSSVTRVTKELNLVSKYRADCFGAEFMRINLEGKVTTDDKGDDTVFFLHIEKRAVSGRTIIFTYYKLDRSRNPYISRGLLQPGTVFNTWLSPTHCLLRQGRFLRSCFYQMDDQSLVFQTTEKNNNLAFLSYNGEAPVIENADVPISSLGERLFTPVLMEFDTIVPRDWTDLIKEDPMRCYSFINDGVTYVGLPKKDSHRPADQKAQTYQLLSAPFNDLTNLINYNGE